MATILNKNLTRETTINTDDQKMLITLTEDQKIRIIKGKGKKAQVVEISIEKLFNQLMNSGGAASDDVPAISLNDFRSAYLVHGKFDYDTKVALETITSNLLKNI